MEKIIKEIPETCKLFLVVGSEIPCCKNKERFPSLTDAAEFSIEFNALLSERIKKYKNVSIINPSKYIKNDDDYLDCIQHYSREVYYDIAAEIQSKTNLLKNNLLIKKVLSLFKRSIRKALSVFKRIINKITRKNNEKK